MHTSRAHPLPALDGTRSPLREVPRFHDEINGTGSDVVHYRGEPGPGVLHYAGPRLIQLDLAPATVRSHRRFMQPHLKQLLLGAQQLEEGEAA
ncbi:hypothetical protein ACGFZ9_46825 [Streptomyces mirabilis]|uniref:hypothetical protein n=1 Tax=Streptomyces TaxID=1883 RepID=UPI0015EE5299|nr:hypothetical protein [Streptomyces sp. WAC00263]KAF5991844.1 hypothetical protein BOG92_008155 [Streptomyces sp. WAC00263]